MPNPDQTAAGAMMSSLPTVKTAITRLLARYAADESPYRSLWESQLTTQLSSLAERLERYPALPPERKNGLEGYLELKVIDSEIVEILQHRGATDELALGEGSETRTALTAFRTPLAAGIAALETPVPRTMHFVWLGRLDATAKEYMSIWAALNPDYAIQLWYDPDALLVNELRQRIVKQAHAEFNDPRASLDQPGLEERIVALQDQAKNFIDDYRRQHPDKVFDDAAIAFMHHHLGGDAAELARLRAGHRLSFSELGSLGTRVVLQDIRTLDFSSDMQAAYQQERDLRNQPAAMSDIVRLHVLNQYGGLHLDSDLLPRLNTKFFTAPAAAPADSDSDYSGSDTDGSDSDAEENVPARRHRLKAQARAEVLQDHRLAELQTQIVLDELARQGQMPQHAEHLRSGRLPDLAQVFESRYGAAATELIAHYRQAVAGQPASALFTPLGEIRVAKGGIAVLDGENKRHQNKNPDIRHWLNAAIAATPNTPMLQHTLQYIGQHYQEFMRDAYQKAHYRYDGFQSSDHPRTFITDLSDNLELRLQITGRTTTSLTGPDALKAGVASYLAQQGMLSGHELVHDSHLAQLLAPLANLDTPEDRKSSWLKGVDDRPANLYAEGSRYAQQLVLQLGDDAAIADAARYLHNKHQTSSRWLRWDNTESVWRDAVTGDTYTAELPADSRVSVVGHGASADGQLRLGGLDGAGLARRVSPLLPAGAQPLQTLRLVGCLPDDVAARPFVTALWQGLDTAKHQVGAVHIGSDDLTQVDVFGRKWGANPVTGGNEPDWTRATGKLIYSRQGDGQIKVASTLSRTLEGHDHTSPPGSSGPLGKPAPDAPPATRIRTAHRLLGASGTGMRLFGTYRSFNAVRQALQQGQYTEASIAAGGFTLNLGSELAERGMQRLGLHLLRRGVVSGRLALRAAPLLNLLTAPWDIYDAARNFSHAAQASDAKARQDALVGGGFALAGLGSTLAVTGLALTGGSLASAAGPVGLVIGAGLIAGSQAYAAYRQVEDIERWLPLTWSDKLQEGARAFVGVAVSAETQARVHAAQLTEQLNQNARLQTPSKLAEQQLALMIGPRIVVEAHEYARQTDGHAQENLMTPDAHAHRHVQFSEQDDAARQHGRQQTCRDDVARAGGIELAGTCPLGAITTRDFEYAIADSDDEVDLARGVDALDEDQRAKLNIARAAKPSRLPAWLDFGNGNDTLHGMRDMPNRFRLGSGSKTIHGGRLDDWFHLDATPDFGSVDSPHHQASRQAQAQRLGGYRYDIDGGAGQDTLVFATDFTDTKVVGYAVDLQTQQFALILPNDTPAHTERLHIGFIRNIEHLQHAHGSGRHHLLGNAGDNRLGGRGHDRLEGREGNDTYVVSLADPDDRVCVRDDNHDAHGAGQWSIVQLEQPLAQLASWSIVGDALRLHAANGATLTLEAVYRDGYLTNARFRLLTRDGFLLTPKLPAKAADFASLAVDAAYLPAADATLAATTAGITLDLAQGTLQRGEQLQQVAAPHRLRMAGGTARDDAFVGTAGNDTFMASAGHDRFEGRGGDDQYVIDDTAGQTDIDTGRGDDVSTLLFAQARLHELTLRGDGGPDLLIDTPHGKTVRHKDSGNAAALIAIDPEGAQLSWLMNPDSLQLDNVTQSAAIQGSRLRSHGAQSNLLVGRRGDDRLDARHSGTVFKGGDGADIYSIEAAGDFLIDNQADDGREDVLHWHGAGQGEQQPLRFERAGEHLILSDDTGASSVTLAGYFAAGGAARHLRIEFQRPDGEVDTLSAADLDSSAQAAPTIELGTLDRQLQRLIDASSRFGAKGAPVLAPAHDTGHATPLLVTPA